MMQEDTNPSLIVEDDEIPIEAIEWDSEGEWVGLEEQYSGSITIEAEREFDEVEAYNEHIETLSVLFQCETYTDEFGKKHLIQYDD